MEAAISFSTHRPLLNRILLNSFTRTPNKLHQNCPNLDPFYDGESYRKDGGDGSVHWLYEKQEDIEEQARAELLREELIEEIEKKVGGLRELEEAKEEELVK